MNKIFILLVQCTPWIEEVREKKQRSESPHTDRSVQQEDMPGTGPGPYNVQKTNM